MKNIFNILVVLMTYFSSYGQLNAPNLHYLDINADKPGAQYKFSFIHLTDIHIGEGIDDYGSSGIIDSMPAGDVGDPAIRLRKSVNWINSNYNSLNIDFVIISGDLTDSGEKSEFLKVKEIMSSLEIPYVPLIGNHDVWSYTKDSVATRPLGDSLINLIFGDVFADNALYFDNWDDGGRLTKIYNPETDNYNYLQNFAFEHKGFKYIMLDFDPRYPAANNEPGIGPEAELMDFQGGTWDWAKQKISGYTDLGDQNLFIVSHHPPLKEFWSVLFAFDLNERKTITDFLFLYKNHIAVWLAGHIHRSLVYNVGTVGLQPYQVLKCAETAANKTYERGLFRIVDVYESPLATSIADDMLVKNIDVFPNPSQGRFHFFLKDNSNIFVPIEVFNSHGQCILQETIAMNKQTRLFEINLSNQSKGIYYLRWKIDDQFLGQQIIIQ